MTNPTDLHQFRVQTPSFLISNSNGDIPLEVFVWLAWRPLFDLIFFIFLQLSNLQQQRIMVEQLRREAAIKRINVSQAIEDIKVSNVTLP